MLREEYLKALHQSIASLDENRFVVKKQLRHVTEFRPRERWEHLTRQDLIDIKNHLSHLPPAEKKDDELARRFDLLVLNSQISLLLGDDKVRGYFQSIVSTAAGLEKKSNIPQIAQHIALIREMRNNVFWQAVDAPRLEEVRLALRHLVQYLDKERQAPVFTHFEDTLEIDDVVIRDPVVTYVSLTSYKERVETYVRENKNHIAIHKLCNNQPLTPTDIDELEKIFFTEEVAGSRAEFIHRNTGSAHLERLSGASRVLSRRRFARPLGNSCRWVH